MSAKTKTSKATKASKLTADASAEATVKKVKPEKSEKVKAENARFSAAVDACVKAGYISGSDDFNCRTFQERCGTTLNLYILESIDRIQKAECVEPDDDKFPANKYYLLSDKTRAVQHSKAVKKTAEVSAGKRQPKKKTAVAEVTPPSIDETDESSASASASANVEPGPVDDAESKEEKVKKNHVTQISKTGKTWLAFVVDRYVYEIYSTDYDKSIKTMTKDTFVKFVLNQSMNFESNITHSIFSTVDRMETSVNNISDHGFASYLTGKIDPMFNTTKEPRANIVRYIVDYLVTYMKLLGYTIARMLWASRRTTDAKVIEAGIRLLDINNDEYLVSNDYIKENAVTRGLSNGGVYRDARKYNDALNPPISEEEKKQRNDKRAASRLAKASGVEPPAKAARAPAKKQAKKVVEPEPEPDYEEETGDADDNEEEEEETEEVEEEDAEEVEVEEEEVKKPVRKMTAAEPAKKK
jgi:hypothetical protein